MSRPTLLDRALAEWRAAPPLCAAPDEQFCRDALADLQRRGVETAHADPVLLAQALHDRAILVRLAVCELESRFATPQPRKTGRPADAYDRTVLLAAAFYASRKTAPMGSERQIAVLAANRLGIGSDAVRKGAHRFGRMMGRARVAGHGKLAGLPVNEFAARVIIAGMAALDEAEQQSAPRAA